jgi:3-methyladenine DNA glycosylase AlkD
LNLQKRASSLAATAVKTALRELAQPRRAKAYARFFKTGPGEYGEGDKFLGIRVPDQRRIARRFKQLALTEISQLLKSPVHEHRFTALEILVAQYEQADERQREKIFRIYLHNTAHINNWDLVDTSARYIVGEHLRRRARKPVYRLAQSKSLWERRIAMVSTQAWISQRDTDDAYALAAMLLKDEHDLIHKAVGWMLREAGVHSKSALLAFISQHYARMPRTTLRYAIEHLAPAVRKRILAGKF